MRDIGFLPPHALSLLQVLKRRSVFNLKFRDVNPLKLGELESEREIKKPGAKFNGFDFN